MPRQISLAFLAAWTSFALPALYAEPQIQNCSRHEEKCLEEAVIIAQGLAQQCL